MISLKWHNLDYPCYPVGRQTTFPVTTKRYVPWVEFVFRNTKWPVILGKLNSVRLESSRHFRKKEGISET